MSSNLRILHCFFQQLPDGPDGRKIKAEELMKSWMKFKAKPDLNSEYFESLRRQLIWLSEQKENRNAFYVF
jgi:hypothetical protein